MGVVKELRMLFKLRAWLRSGQLKAGGIIGLLALVQTWLASQDGIDLVAWLATLLHVMSGTLMGILTGIIALVILFFRARTEWSLSEKVAGIDKIESAQQPPAGG